MNQILFYNLKNNGKIVNKLLAVLFRNFKLLNSTFMEEEVISKNKFSTLEQFMNSELVTVKVFD